MVHLIEKYKVNVLLTPPSQVAMLLQSPVLKLADLSSVRVYVIGGGFLADNLRSQLQDHLLYGTIIFTLRNDGDWKCCRGDFTVPDSLKLIGQNHTEHEA